MHAPTALRAAGAAIEAKTQAPRRSLGVCVLARRSLGTAAAGRRRRVYGMGTPAFVSFVSFVFFVMDAVGSSQRDSERR
jgi:hypothetical protein